MSEGSETEEEKKGWLDKLWGKFSKKAEEKATEAVTDTATGFLGGVLNFVLNIAIFAAVIGGVALLAKSIWGKDEEAEAETGRGSDSDPERTQSQNQNQNQSRKPAPKAEHVTITQDGYKVLREEDLGISIPSDVLKKWREMQARSDSSQIVHMQPLSGNHSAVKITSGATINRNGRPHDGVDITLEEVDTAVRKRTEVLASADGVVLFAGELQGYGRTIVIGHEDGRTITLYAHLNEEGMGAIKPGSHVKAGQAIAYMGDTGRTDSVHLHYEQRKVLGLTDNGGLRTEVLVPKISTYPEDLTRDAIKRIANNGAGEYVLPKEGCSPSDMAISGGSANITCAPPKVALLERESRTREAGEPPKPLQMPPPAEQDIMCGRATNSSSAAGRACG